MRKFAYHAILSNYFCIFAHQFWRRVRVVEGASLESLYTGNCIASSNLAVSAFFINPLKFQYVCILLKYSRVLKSALNSLRELKTILRIITKRYIVQLE